MHYGADTHMTRSPPGLQGETPVEQETSRVGLHPAVPQAGSRGRTRARAGLGRAFIFCCLASVQSSGCSEYELIVWDSVDTFQQNPPESVDILLVVDNSGSMAPYQEKLGQNFESFLTYFVEADIDYHIAAITTDITTQEAGRIQGPVITTETDNADAVFMDIVNVGVQGSGFEMGLEAARLALSEPNISMANAGFLREDASLSLLFVSDEEDSSPSPVNVYINDFQNVKGQRDRDIFNGSALVVTDLGSCSPEAMDWSSESVRYVDVADQTGGVVGNICSDDFANIVTDLSLNVSRLEDTFYLSTTPQVSSLQVWVDDRLIDCSEGEWSYQLLVELDDSGEEVEMPAIVFHQSFLPPSNSRIIVKYNWGGGDPADFCTESSTEVSQ